MAVRSFTVFQDTPADVPHSLDSADAPTPSPTDPAPALLSTLAAIEKENLHPLTGQRAGPAPSDAKKRKTVALATKLLPVPSSKKRKELPESSKSRKPLSASVRPRGSDARKSTSKPHRASRKASSLPPVDEEQEVVQHQPPRLSTSQLDIDSRCYDLTVSPLADVSDAYDAGRAPSQEPDAHTDTQRSVEPPIRDDVSPSPVDKPLPTTNDYHCRNPDPAPLQTTPERKRIHSAFTFSSPSPTSDRFKQAHPSPVRRDSPASNSE